MLAALSEAICDDKGRPLQNIRIRHTIILDDPYPDPPQLEEHIPEGSPEPVFATVMLRPCISAATVQLTHCTWRR